MGLSGPKFCLKQRHVLLEGCHPAHSPAVCNSISHIVIHWGGGKVVLRKEGLSMLIKDTVMDQRTSLDHQCDLVASISHWDVSVVRKQGQLMWTQQKEGERGGLSCWGNRTHKVGEKEGKTGKTAGRLKSKPAFNFSQTTWSWCPMPYILTGIYSRPLPASDTDGDRNIQVLFTQIFWRCFPCGALCWQRQLAKSTKPNFVTELLISIWRRIEGKKWL